MARPPTVPVSARVVGQAWQLAEVLGSGSFAIVWKARHVSTGQLAAVKEILTDRLNKKLQESLESEIAVLQRVKHANIVGLLDLYKEPGRIFLVLEYCAGGDLAQHLRLRGPLPEASCRYLLRHLAEGLKVLRQHNIIHRDLKPQNLLLSDSGPSPTLKIADFGFARSLQPAGLAETLCGSPLYMAPEVLQLHRYDAKADLWSVGTILFELLTGKPPFSGANHLQLVQAIERGDACLPEHLARALSPGCRQLLSQLLKRNPVERISFDELFAHPFLQGEAASAAVQFSGGVGVGSGALPPVALPSAVLPPADGGEGPMPLAPPPLQRRATPPSLAGPNSSGGRPAAPVHPLLQRASPPQGATPSGSPNGSQGIAPQAQARAQAQATTSAPDTAVAGAGAGPAAAVAAAPGGGIAVREVTRSPSPRIVAAAAVVATALGAEAAAATPSAAAAAAPAAAARAASGSGNLADSLDSDYVVVASPSATQRPGPSAAVPSAAASPRIPHPVFGAGPSSRGGSGGGAPAPSPAPSTAPSAAPSAATAAAAAAPTPTSAPPPAWQHLLSPIAAAAATPPATATAALPYLAAAAAGSGTTMTIRVPGEGADGSVDPQLLPRVVGLLLDHARSRATAVMDAEAEARGGCLGGDAAGLAASAFGAGLGGAGGGLGQGGLAEEAAAAVGTLLVAARLLAAALSATTAVAAAASGGSSGASSGTAAAAVPDGDAEAPAPPAAADGDSAPASAAETAAAPTVAATAAAPSPEVAAALTAHARAALAALDEMDLHGTLARLLAGSSPAEPATASAHALGPSTPGGAASPVQASAAAPSPPTPPPLVPCSLDALLAAAVHHSRAAAGEELLGNAVGAVEQYGRAADVLLFLLAAPPPLAGAGAASAMEPAASQSESLFESVRAPLAPTDRQRLTKYYAAVRLRQSAALSALGPNAAAAAANYRGGGGATVGGNVGGMPYGNAQRAPAYGAVVF